jgi:class 3 adenylate cyclase
VHPVAELPSGTVTFLFTDIEGSTPLWEQHPQAMRDALARHDVILTDGIEGCNGIVVKNHAGGDSFFAVFADAADAVVAACRLQLTLSTERWPPATPLRVRMARPACHSERGYRAPSGSFNHRVHLDFCHPKTA